MIPTGTDPLYVTAATASSNTASDTIASNEWSSPVILAQNGTNGDPGAAGSPGLNTATVFLYKRAENLPDKPSSSTYGTVYYNFSTGKLYDTEAHATNNTNAYTNLGGWTQAVPASNENRHPCWMIQATAVSSSVVDSIASTEWSDQIKMIIDGEDGDDGKGVSSIENQYCLAALIVSDVPGTTRKNKQGIS